MVLSILAVALTSLFTTGLVYRLAAFREDWQHPGGFFGTPPDSLIDILSRKSYRPEAHWMLPLLAASFTLLVATWTWFLAMLSRTLL